MKNVVRSLLKYIFGRLYYIIKEARQECEGRPLSLLRSCGDAVRHGDGFVIIGPEHISIGYGCGFGRGCRIDAIDFYNGQTFTPELFIGNNVTMEDWCHVGCIDRIEIGDGTMIASRVFITDHYHGSITTDDLQYDRPASRPLSSKPVKIGKNVWIGEGVCIMPGVTLGDSVIVGANAVVTHDFPANSVIAGCPARVIRNLL